MNLILTRAQELNESSQPFVIATLIEVIGGAPQETGAKMIIEKSGAISGTIGGGKLEAKTIKEAQNLLEQTDLKRFSVKTWNLQTDVGMTCGGKVSITFETYGVSNWNIALFGAGHVAQALSRTLINLDCTLTCYDSRSEWVGKFPQSPKLSSHVEANADDSIARLPKNTFFVVMTQGHATDLPVLHSIFKHHPHAPFVGCMGSSVKAIRLKKDLLELGISLEQVNKLETPIGLPIGENTPEEIAISVTAQLLEVRSRFTRDNAALMNGKR
ncbi:MAG: xanthine dehydrogenase accessory protein XdhC [Xanthomonadaceae bacterium]|nr:xanthine dehydrogenase accessory protein XdhC [Xanthomonadaceae bacterium]